MRLLKYSTVFVLLVFIFPALTHMAIWATKDRPASWSHANWSSAGILPNPTIDDAQIMLLAARTGGMKGALATHSWLVLKKPGETRWHRYEVVGWGMPVRHNAYDADGRWYSNAPVIYHKVEGERAARLIGRVEQAIETYKWRKRGDYRIWPGPNSNTFVASVLRAVPELGWETPSTAVGRDFPADDRWFAAKDDGRLCISLAGYAGLNFNPTSGLDLNFLGLVAGLDWQNWRLKVPGFGTLG